MCSHLAMTGSWLPKRWDFNCTSYFMNRFWMHLRRWGGSYTAAISRLWNLKDGLLLVAPNSFKALTLLDQYQRHWQQPAVQHPDRRQEPHSITAQSSPP
jgi:hypothetical protein